jgi:hypothetical protein
MAGPFATFQIAPVKTLLSLCLSLVAVSHTATVVPTPGTPQAVPLKSPELLSFESQCLSLLAVVRNRQIKTTPCVGKKDLLQTAGLSLRFRVQWLG